MKMKIVLLMLVAMVAATQAELLTNPGFEDGVYGAKNIPDGWVVWSPSYTTGWTWQSTGGVGGDKCMLLTGGGSAYYSGYMGQYVAAAPGQEFTFSAWAKSPTQGVPAKPYGYFTWFSTGGGYLGYGYLYPDISTVGDTWTQISFGSIVAPEGTAEMGIWLWGNGNAASGGILYDDASLIPEPVTLGLLGLGALMLRRRK